MLQAGEVPKGLRDTALKALVIQRDSGDCPILVAGNSFPFAAVITLPKFGEVGILRELCEELEEGGSLQLCAGTGAGHQGDEQNKGKANGRYVRSDAVLLA